MSNERAMQMLFLHLVVAVCNMMITYIPFYQPPFFQIYLEKFFFCLFEKLKSRYQRFVLNF